jgi:hypothetical protein
MVDLATTQAQAKGVAPSTTHEGGQIEAAAAKHLNALPPPSTNGVDRLYRQLAEIHVIATTQLAECTRWCWSDPTSSPIHAKVSWQRPTVELLTARRAPPPLIDFSP